MKKSYSNTTRYLTQLKSIEQQISKNQLQEAVHQLNLLVRTNPHDPRLFLLGARLAEVARNEAGMLQAARKAHDLAPEWPSATIHLGGVLASRGEAEEAIAMAELAVEQVAAQETQAGNEIEIFSKAVAVAQRLNLHQRALQWLQQAQQIDHDNPAILAQIARTLTHAGEHSGAIDILTNLLQQLPGEPTLLSDRMRALLLAQLTEKAIQDGEKLLALDPDNDVYQFYMDIARGQIPAVQPNIADAGLFGGYAARADYHLMLQLLIRMPREVAHMILQWYPNRTSDVLELGCGVGLLGAHLGPIKGVLVGVELSGEMIEQASRHGVYDRFHHVNALDALQATPDELYNVIAALTMFNHLGSLDVAIPNAYRILSAGGHLVFSYEAGLDGEADYVLQAGSRYRHQRSYVQRLLLNAGFVDIAETSHALRLEAGRPVQGLLVTASKGPPQLEKKRSGPSRKPRL